MTGALEAPDHYSNGAARRYAKKTAEFAQQIVEPGAVIFVGDSLIENAPLSSMFEDLNAINWGIGFDETAGLLKRSDQVISAQPSALIVLIGANDIANSRDAKSTQVNLSGYLRAVTDMRAVDVTVLSALPQNAEQQVAIAAFNEMLEQEAERFDVRFVDLHSHFVDGDGAMKSGLSVDGVHLNEEGYALMAQLFDQVVNFDDSASERVIGMQSLSGKLWKIKRIEHADV